ncbi:hypothetical protein BOTBODRAFT_97125, partial [Botryobasidium botryosum FD-172 SS1]
LQSILSQNPSSPTIASFLSSLSPPEKLSPSPEVKAYSDAVYFNYYALGLSLLFVPVGGYKPQTGTPRESLQDQSLKLESIDVYNVLPSAADDTESTKSRKPLSNSSYTAFSAFPISVSIPRANSSDSPTAAAAATVSDGTPRCDITPESTGKDFVGALGEPKRKGGGQGPAAGSIGIWCEWPNFGLMVEFGGNEARGPQAWERGKDALWTSLTIFQPKS